MCFKKGNRFYRTLTSNKKRGFLGILTLSVSVVIGGYYFLTSWLSGFLIARYLGSKEVGKPSKLPSIIVPLGKLRVHLHHWFISSIVIGVTLLKGWWGLPPELLRGFLGGIALQGIYYYSDWHRIFKRK